MNYLMPPQNRLFSKGVCMKDFRNTKKKIITVLLYIFFGCICIPVSSQENLPSYILQANYRTAQRCLELARDAIGRFDYEESLSLVTTGLDYDQSIPDLWYLKSLLLSYKDTPKFMVKEAVEASLKKNTWLYYNPDAARVLYAQVLVKTSEEKKAIEVLNQSPLIVTSDAEYIRAEAYYKLSQADKAREIIANARKSYPKDPRFPLLFFSWERFTYDHGNAYYNELLQNLLRMADTWKESESNILLYASYFLQGEQRIRNLKEYRLSEHKDPLYIAAFLETGLISEQEAVEALFSFADTEIAGSVFFEVLSIIKSEEAFLQIAEKLEKFSGTLMFDENRDNEYDVFVTYMSGRPYSIKFDDNADGFYNWYAELDYGVPVKIECNDDKAELYYSRYPYIASAKIYNDEEVMDIQLIDNTVDWKPFNLESIPLIGNLVFYVPSLVKQAEFIQLNQFLQNASEIVVTGGIDNSTSIRFSMRDSLPKTAVYTRDGKPFAYGFFEDGLLVFRNVDNDGNGSYELSEMYDFNPDVSRLYVNEAQSRVMYKELFGSLSANEGLYVTKVIADTDDNSLIDFMEEYGSDGSKKTSWDTDEDGTWDLSYVKNMSTERGLEEQVSTTHPLDKSLIVIRFKDREPLDVVIHNAAITITKHPDLPFYWIGTVPSDSSYAQTALNALQKEQVQGLRILVKPDQNSNSSILAIKVNDLYFGEYINE